MVTVLPVPGIIHACSRYSVNTYWMLVSELIYQTLTVVFKLLKYIAWNCWPTGSRSDWALLIKLLQPDPSLLTVPSTCTVSCLTLFRNAHCPCYFLCPDALYPSSVGLILQDSAEIVLYVFAGRISPSFPCFWETWYLSLLEHLWQSITIFCPVPCQ